MMTVCSGVGRHEQIVISCSICPLCAALRKIKELEAELLSERAKRVMGDKK